MNIVVKSEADCIIVTRSWRSLSAILVMLAFPFIGYVLLFFCYLLFSSNSGLLGAVEGVFFLGVVVVLGYNTAADIVNQTRLTLDKKTFSFEHGPMPWPGTFKCSTASGIYFVARKHWIGPQMVLYMVTPDGKGSPDGKRTFLLESRDAAEIELLQSILQRRISGE